MDYSRIIKTNMGDDSYVFDMELWNRGMEEKARIELTCLNESEAESKAAAIEQAISAGQGYEIKRREPVEKSYRN